MKYVMFERMHVTGCKQLVPIIFPDNLAHSEISDMLKEAYPDMQPTSAGDINIEVEACYGHSESLNLKARSARDKLCIQTYDYLHGIQA